MFKKNLSALIFISIIISGCTFQMAREAEEDLLKLEEESLEAIDESLKSKPYTLKAKPKKPWLLLH